MRRGSYYLYAVSLRDCYIEWPDELVDELSNTFGRLIDSNRLKHKRMKLSGNRVDLMVLRRLLGSRNICPWLTVTEAILRTSPELWGIWNELASVTLT